jgi:BirA family transcriptional regulator, biotin operon repressor / biotin---[acetyl-CoA-carboxylase] ligase
MIWPAEDLWQALVAWQPGLTVEVLPQIDSTNTELMRRARAGQQDAVLLVAEAQTAGRGRLGRPWHGQAGEALTFSLGLPLLPQDWSGLSLAVGLSLVHSLDPDGAFGLRLKWPNDVWVAQPGTPSGWGKLAGVLIETLGLQQLSPQATAPNTLAQVALPLLKTLLAFERDGFAPLQPRFNACDALRDRAVSLSDGRTGTARGVDVDGALCVDMVQGRERITSNEVSVRPQ